MVKHFADNSTRPTRALQAWLILIGQARIRQTLTYGALDKLMSFGFPFALGPILDYIFWYCRINQLPPLALIVVSKETGKPGEWEGMDRIADAPRNQAVFDFDWYSLVPPTPEELRKLISCRQYRSRSCERLPV